MLVSVNNAKAKRDCFAFVEQQNIGTPPNTICADCSVLRALYCAETGKCKFYKSKSQYKKECKACAERVRQLTEKKNNSDEGKFTK